MSVNYTVETYRETYETAVECDNCGDLTPTIWNGTAEQVYEYARRRGWIITPDGDYCPACQRHFVRLTGERHDNQPRLL